MAPIRRGTSEQFWYVACHADLDPNDRDPRSGQTALLQDGWFIYEVAHLHGSHLFKVRESDGMAHFPRVLEQLNAEAKNADPNNYVRAGYLQWRAMEQKERNGVQGLLEEIHKARAALFRSKSPERNGYERLQLYLLKERLRQAKWYWANLLFEFVFLSGLVWFTLWPTIRRKRPWLWALHFGLAPLLFMLPVYLGYATYTFTSRGPSGGVLYPWLLTFSYGGRMNSLDRRIIDRLPQILEPLSQGIGAPTALTGMGLWGPTAVLCLSAFVALLALATAVWFKHRNKSIPDTPAAS
jgi:hypothetical protein